VIGKKEMSFLNRFPKIQQIIPVYAVGVTLLYSWTIFRATKDFSANWSLFLNVGDILGLFSYMLVGDFLESLLMICSLLLLSFLLPRNLLTNKFNKRGSILAITFLCSIMVFYLRSSEYLFPNMGIENINWWIVTFVFIFTVSALVLLAAGESFQMFGKFVESIADRCIIFLYFYLPLTFLSIVAIIFRNIG